MQYTLFQMGKEELYHIGVCFTTHATGALVRDSSRVKCHHYAQLQAYFDGT